MAGFSTPVETAPMKETSRLAQPIAEAFESRRGWLTQYGAKHALNFIS